MVSNTHGSFNSSIKKTGPKIKISPKKHSGNPIKLDRNLKNIEKRILQKMKSKNGGQGIPALVKMPSIERNKSPNFPQASGRLLQESDYRAKPSKNRRYKFAEGESSSMITLSRSKVNPRNEKSSISQSTRQTVAGSFRPNDADSIIRNIQAPKPLNDHYSEYNLYNSYGSSNGFSEEKRLSNKMKYKIKSNFKYRDELETAETDSFFSSKFSKFNVPANMDGQTILKPNRSLIEGMKKMKGNENLRPIAFPNISKRIPDCNSGSFPSIS